MIKVNYFIPEKAPQFTIDNKLKFAVTSFTYWREEKGGLNTPPTPSSVEVHKMMWYAYTWNTWHVVSEDMMPYIAMEYNNEILKAVEDEREEENEI